MKEHVSQCTNGMFFGRWTFNNSAEAKTVSSRFIRTNGSTSLLTFTPTRTLEYGTLMCWSRNSVGEQRDPCIFHIIAAGNILLETIYYYTYSMPHTAAAAAAAACAVSIQGTHHAPDTHHSEHAILENRKYVYYVLFYI